MTVYVYICLREKKYFFFFSFGVRNKKKCFSIVIELAIVNGQAEYLISQLLSGRRKKIKEKGTVISIAILEKKEEKKKKIGLEI